MSREKKLETWNIVHDCDLDDGTPTEWSLKVAEGKWFWYTWRYCHIPCILLLYNIHCNNGIVLIYTT